MYYLRSLYHNPNRMGRPMCRPIYPLIILTIILTLLLTPITTLAESNLAPEYDLDYFIQVKELIENYYLTKPSEKELMEGAMKGLFYNLDENSSYYTKEEFQQLMENTSGKFVGVGIYIKEQKGNIIITEPIKGGPAYKAGIKPKDQILAIDDKNIKGLPIDEVTALIKGKANTKVKLKVKRGQKPISFNITRQEIKLNPIEYQILKDNIGYIRISQFNQYAYENMVEALKAMDEKNISNIIIDLRDNPGGLLGQVIDISKLLIPEGPIVHIQYNGKIQESYYSTLKKAKYNLVLLVNQYSASASEILAAAVKDRNIGKIVGVPTYGKGTVQQIVPLPNGDGMKLTIAQYLSPNKESIHNKGIIPDIIVQNQNTTTDRQLNVGVDLCVNPNP